jgi:ribosomal 50S subunit-associated protein YjgA (DUF615 family)
VNVNEKDANLATYSIVELYASGMRFVDDYDAEAAIEHYMELHPDADRQAVEVELQEHIAKRGKPGKQ